QRAKIVHTAHRVRAIKLDVIGVVLNPFEYTVAVGVPSSVDPCKLQSLSYLGPKPAEPVIIAGELPVNIGLDDLTHIAICGRRPAGLFAFGKGHADRQKPVKTIRHLERSFAHRPG